MQVLGWSYEVKGRATGGVKGRSEIGVKGRAGGQTGVEGRGAG